uniref:Zinc finger FYVE domain-containing protein 1 n=1 Tax=Pavo cristatus TaxID=9049 RepID=A0A8C9EMB7_PAVCR
MSAHTQTAEKGQNTALLCQESYVCSGTDEAVFECDECRSLQCQRCEEELHQPERLRNHERTRIRPGHVPYCDSCKGANGNIMHASMTGSRQIAAVRCQVCKINLCVECQKRTHAGGNRRKHPVTVYHAGKAQEQDEEEMDEETRRRKMAEKVVSFLLVDETEEIQVRNEEDFIKKLDCSPDQHLKVVSIFGNTGDGKSHTLNHAFFYGREVFKTSPAQESCTVGVWAAYDPVRKVVVIDTEGLLGATVNLSQRTRLLLKVLAISDLVIYRTRADRLHNDLFKFLGDASEAYLKHFTKELKATTARCGLDVPLSTLGPGVIIFHETVYTKLLGSVSVLEAFSLFQYKHKIVSLAWFLIFALALSDRFSGEIPDDQMAHSSFFPDEYFTCSSVCLSCGCGCKKSMNHTKEGVPHESKSRCRYSHQYDNRVYTCKACYERGMEVSVVPKTSASTDSPWLGLAKYAWSGYVIECPNCGVVYRSRQYWFGNQDPVNTVVRTEIEHVWPGTDGFLKDNNNAAQRLLDGMNFMAQSVSELSMGPTKAVTSWLTDQIAPAYWRPNSQILSCNKCNTPFKDNDTKHHCRACGEGFCDGCSSKTRPVPERGWGPAPVRVCDNCYENRGIQLGNFELTVTELSLGNGLKSLSLAPGSQFSLGVNSIVQVGFGLEFLVLMPKSLMTFGRKRTLATSYQIFYSLIELLSNWIFASFSQHLLMVQS